MEIPNISITPHFFVNYQSLIKTPKKKYNKNRKFLAQESIKYLLIGLSKARERKICTLLKNLKCQNFIIKILKKIKRILKEK